MLTDRERDQLISACCNSVHMNVAGTGNMLTLRTVVDLIGQFSEHKVSVATEEDGKLTLNVDMGVQT